MAQPRPVAVAKPVCLPVIQEEGHCGAGILAIPERQADEVHPVLIVEPLPEERLLEAEQRQVAQQPEALPRAGDLQPEARQPLAARQPVEELLGVVLQRVEAAVHLQELRCCHAG